MNNKYAVPEIIQYFKQETAAVMDEQLILEELQQDQEEQSSVAIKILSVFGGIFATLAFFGFLLLVGLYDSEVGLLFFGILCIAGALAIHKAIRKTITDTSSICVYMAGHGLLAFGMVSMESNANIICIVFIGISYITLYVTQTYVLSFIAALTALLSLFTMIFIEEAYNAIHVYVIALTFLLTVVLLNEATIIKQLGKFSKLFAPVSMALIVAFIVSLGFLSINELDFISIEIIWFSSIITIPAVVFVSSRILKIYEVEKVNIKITAYAAVGFILLPTLYAPAISGALLILLLCFLINHKTGFAVGIVSFIYFVAQFYYDLHFTLLLKSIILFSTGIFCLLIYVFLIKKLESNEKI
jgi:hypothetical protein